MPHVLRHLLLFLLLGLVPVLAYATTYHVAKGGSGSTCAAGSPCGTVNTGLSKLAQSGDVLYIHAGTYDENILPTAVPVSGTSWSNVTPGGSVVWVGAYFNGSTYDNVTINGHSTNGVLAMWGGANYVVWDHLHINSTTSHESEYTPIKAGDNAQLFQYGEITETNTGCSSVLTAGAALIVIHSNPGQIVSGGPWFRGNLIHDSWCALSFYFQVYADGTIIEQNIIADQPQQGMQLYTDCAGGCPKFHNITIRGNTFRNNGKGNEFIVTGPTLDKAALAVYACENCAIYNNVFHDNANSIAIENTSIGVKIYNNTFYNNSSSATINTISINTNTSNTDIRNNLAYLSGPALVGGVCAGCGTGSYTESNNSFGVNPNFADISGGNRDLRLTASTPTTIRDAGTCLAAVPTDKEGNARPAGAGTCDIGAYEYGGVVTPPTPTLPAPTNLRLGWQP